MQHTVIFAAKMGTAKDPLPSVKPKICLTVLPLRVSVQKGAKATWVTVVRMVEWVDIEVAQRNSCSVSSHQRTMIIVMIWSNDL